MDHLGKLNHSAFKSCANVFCSFFHCKITDKPRPIKCSLSVLMAHTSVRLHSCSRKVKCSNTFYCENAKV